MHDMRKLFRILKKLFLFSLAAGVVFIGAASVIERMNSGSNRRSGGCSPE